ncbi:hypothetical protein CDCA_CDCA20G4784 [Cyanidium caldarium]|uniref:CCAAT-binding factor domain-containing protein n=1 Tax=Cyanidium caldarium TaxID=2771 RepID=A0AAV9J361_CYACA|nr:hypothetical protein CDCA_CDCA20G4784 [Cyanidium caldarium]
MDNRRRRSREDTMERGHQNHTVDMNEVLASQMSPQADQGRPQEEAGLRGTQRPSVARSKHRRAGKAFGDPDAQLQGGHGVADGVKRPIHRRANGHGVVAGGERASASRLTSANGGARRWHPPQERDPHAAPSMPTKRTRASSSSAAPVDPQDFLGGAWYECAPADLPPLKPVSLPPSAATSTSAPTTSSSPSVQKWWQQAEAALHRLSDHASRPHRAGRRAPAASPPHGTLMDTIAAHTLNVQSSPLHHLEDLRRLVHLATTECKHRRQERWTAVEALKDLFVHDLLPPGRKLVAFAARDWDAWAMTADASATQRILAYTAFESELKTLYATYVQEAVQACANDTVEFLAQRATGVLSELLVAHPEQEQLLLAALVYKLGAPQRKVASKALYCLQQLVNEHHPAMRLVVTRAVLRFAAAQRSAWTQQTTSPESSRPTKGGAAAKAAALAAAASKRPRGLYYAVSFLSQLRWRGGVDTGAEESNTARQAIRLYLSLFRECMQREQSHSRLLAALLSGMQRALPAARRRAVYRVDRARADDDDDDDDDQVAESLGADIAAQVDALYTVVHRGNAVASTRALMLLMQMGRSDRFYRALYAVLAGERWDTLGGSKLAALFQVCHRAMKSDPCTPRVLAMLKRLLQTASHAPSSTACGALMLTSEVLFAAEQAPLRTMLPRVLPPASGEAGSEMKEGTRSVQGGVWDEAAEEEEEHFVDVDRELDADDETCSKVAIPSPALPKPTYDITKRDPKYAGAEHTRLWELLLLRQHAHPTVCEFARTLLSGQRIEYSGDPVEDHTLSALLGRLSYRRRDRQERKGGGDRQRQPMNTYEALVGGREAVSTADRFLYDYFERSGLRERILHGRQEDAESEREEDDVMEALEERDIENDDEESVSSVDDLSEEEEDDGSSSGASAGTASSADVDDASVSDSAASSTSDARGDSTPRSEHALPRRHRRPPRRGDTRLPARRRSRQTDRSTAATSPHGSAPANKRRRARHSAVFASAEAYAHLLTE